MNGCYKVVNQRLNWTDAGLECRSLHKDAHLLVINDVQKQWSVAGWLHSTGRNLFHIIYQQDCLSAGQTAIINFRPHRSRPTMYVGAAYCYRRSSVVCLSVCHDREPRKNSTVGLLPDGYVPVHKAINRITSFFPIVDTCLICEDIARRSCAMVPRWRLLATFLGPAFAASRVQRLSDLHSIFALGPHHVSKYGRHPTCGR